MITNKYESPPNYQNLKQLRLRQIQEDYFPPPRNKCCQLFSSPVKYTHTTDYASRSTDDFSPREVLQVKNSIGINIIQIVFAVFGFFFPVIPKPDGTIELGAWLFMLTGLVLIVHSIIKIRDKRSYLTIHGNGMYFYKSSLFIPWEHTIATHVFEDTSGDDNTYKLVTDYVDGVTGECRTELFTISGYDKSAGEIALAISWYQHKYPALSENTILTIKSA
jgi:hypothetical protein